MAGALMAIIAKTLAQFVTALEDGDVTILASVFKPVSTGNPRNFIVVVRLIDATATEVWDVAP